MSGWVFNRTTSRVLTPLRKDKWVSTWRLLLQSCYLTEPSTQLHRFEEPGTENWRCASRFELFDSTDTAVTEVIVVALCGGDQAILELYACYPTMVHPSSFSSRYTFPELTIRYQFDINAVVFGYHQALCFTAHNC
ncbi:hypothetical protein GOBAR_AA36795 [Gossypium barbadense]|uniref:Uncharacterized protein n=1 Tax=Gossypium barbadense TaxID=3634 RepID=A0A2P5VYM9_GOSBA|nr:hypothetical protein GOBAR_AA36795 [Gossypium barbadense]